VKKAEKAIVILARIVRRKLEIFFAQLPELLQLLQSRPGVSPSPTVKRLFGREPKYAWRAIRDSE